MPNGSQVLNLQLNFVYKKKWKKNNNKNQNPKNSNHIHTYIYWYFVSFILYLDKYSVRQTRDAIFRVVACWLITGERIVLQPLMASRIHQTLLNVGHTMVENGQNGSSVVTRRDHNIDYSTLFVQLSGTFPTLYRCVSCHKTVSNRWHHANIHRPQSHECPVCGQKFTRRDNMKAHCKIKHADIKDRYFNHYVHMWPMNVLLKYRRKKNKYAL